jgi:hypothetical protein
MEEDLNWRLQIVGGSRLKNVNKKEETIMETLRK